MLDLRKMDLKTKAAVFIAVILILVMGLSNVILTSTVTARLEAALLTSSTLVGQGLVGEILKTVDMGIYLEELEGLSDQLTATVDEHPDLGYIFISNNQGKTLYQSEGIPEWIPEDIGVPPLNEENPSEAVVTDIKSGRAGFYNISLGIVSGGAVQGILNVGLRAEVVKAELRSMYGRMVGVGVVSFFIATALIIIFVNRLISRPLANLAQTAREISGGNLVSVPVEERGDEIGELAGAFQVMVGG
ncbi:HAMP domain-containing protein, partial [bacterium]